MALARITMLAGLLAAGCGGSSSAAGPTTAAPDQAPAPDGQEGYAIRLHRPAHVGDRHLIVIEAERAESQVGTQGEQTVLQNARESRVSLSAIRTVTAVNERGKVTGARFEVIEANEASSEGTRTLVEQGGTLILTRTVEGGTIELEGGTLDESVVEALKVALHTTVAPETDDEVYGTDAPQSVGASWDLNRTAAATGLSRGGKLHVEPDDLGGEVRLDGLETVDGVECLQVSADMTASRVEVLGLPPGSEVQRGEFAASFEGAFPTDESRPRVRGSTGLVARIDITTPGMNGQPVAIHTEMRQARSEVLSEVPE